MGSNSGSPPGPVSWPTGVYVLEATIQYRYDSESVTETIEDNYSAVLDIAPGGVMTLSDASGVCRDLTSREAQDDEEQRGQTFRCGRSEYALEMSGGTLGGEMTAYVDERIKQNEGCVRPRPGTTQCSEYRWVVNSRPTQKRARLTVIPRS